MRLLRRSTPPQVRTALPAVLTLALSVGLSGAVSGGIPAYAEPTVPSPSGPSGPPTVSAPAAEQALEHATAVLTGVDDATGSLGAATSGPADATLALLDLRKQLPQLDPRDRRDARELMARPDGNVNGADQGTGAVYDPLSSPKSTCDSDQVAVYGSLPFCVHWASNPASRHHATAAEVSGTVTIMKKVWATTTGSMAYRAPRPDGTRGGNSKLDVYLADTGDNGVFGYAVPEEDPVVSAGYLVLENDFAEFANTQTSPTEFRQVTAAHEFFHLVQFAYDSYDSHWLMESTATWMEEQIYPSVNDNRNYIPSGSLRRPWQSVDTFQGQNGTAHYGTWVFHELYTRSLGDQVVRRVWQYAALPAASTTTAPTTNRDNSRWSLSRALAERNWNLTTAMRTFGGSSLAPRLFYADGAAYPSAILSRSWKLTRSARSTGARSVKLAHLAGAAYDFQPGGSLTGRWNLRLKVDAPATESVAYAIVFYRDGSTRRIAVGLNRYGNKTFSVPFRYGSVRRVALYVGNASAANGRVTTFRATAWR